MAKRSAGTTAPKGTSRIAIVMTGVVLGALWGTVMWALIALFGDGSGVTGWLYTTFSVACIGGGVAAVFGAVGVARRGERVGPRLFGRRRGR